MIRACTPLSFILNLMCTCACAAAVPLLTPADAPGLVIEREKRFEGTALYGHINGGADLYLEYGFVRLGLQQVVWKGGKYTIEVHEMSDEDVARGISSVTRLRTVPLDSLGPLFCVSRYHVQGACGRWFVRIVETTGTAQEGLRSLASILRRKIDDRNPAGTTRWVPDAIAPVLADVVLARGPLGLQNGHDGFSRLLDGIDGYEISLVQLSLPEGTALVADVRFSREEARAAYVRRSDSGPFPFRRRWEVPASRVIQLQASFPADSLAGVVAGLLDQNAAPEVR
jgi:hypothetical protein